MRFSVLVLSASLLTCTVHSASVSEIFGMITGNQAKSGSGGSAARFSTPRRAADPAAPASVITDFILVNTKTKKDIMLLHDATKVDVTTYGDQLSIRVETASYTGPVKMDFDGTMQRVEPEAPYHMAGDEAGEIFSSFTLAQPGKHYLTACPNEGGLFTRPENNHQTDGLRRKLADEPGCLTIAFETINPKVIVETPPPPVEKVTDVEPAVADIYGYVSGEFKVWHKVTVAFSGPPASETGMTIPGAYRAPSTFADYRLDVTFQNNNDAAAADGAKYIVPGYYAGDGDAANNKGIGGNVWQCHFTPPTAGIWNWTASYAQGTNVAQNGGGNPGGFFDGSTGSFDVEATNKTGRDFRSKGRLRAVPDKNYYQFSNGEYFMKVGPDSPQNLLAYDDFDGATNKGSYSKSYAPHEIDYNIGDPTFKNGNGTGLIGAMNYLSDKGMNAMSVTTFNVNGADRNVFPFVRIENQLQYDISKLAQWAVIFDYADQVGISLRVKLQDAASDSAINKGSLFEERKLYYREMIARFGHHLGVVWDLGEDLPADKVAERAEFIRLTDPYSSPITVRTNSATVIPELLAIATVDGVSLHTEDMSKINANTISWLAAGTGGLVVSSDEQGIATTGVVPDVDDPEHNTVRQDVLWCNLMAGGSGVQYYFGTSFAESDLTLQDFRSRATLWDQSRYALEFFATNKIPFAAMASANSLVSAGSLCLAAADASTIVVYKKAGSGIPTVTTKASYKVSWYNPRKGGALATTAIATVPAQTAASLGPSPDSDDLDWVILLLRSA